MAEFRLETPRLILRDWQEGDGDAFYQLALDPDVMAFLPPLQRRKSDDLITRMIAAQAEYGCCFWAVERKEDGALLGFCGVMPPRPPLSEPEIGWRLARHAWGQGYAREAASACLEWAWQDREWPTIVAITVPANIRSWGLMERLGMTRDPAEDFDHPAIPEGDPLRRHMLYRITRPDA